MDIRDIKLLCKSGALRWTDHVIMRLIQRGVNREDVKYVLIKGEIIEQYPDDYPFPSCLLYGKSLNGNPLHVVCGRGTDELWVITAYRPSLIKWNDDYKTRRRLRQ